MAQFALILWFPLSFALVALLRPATAATVGLVAGLLLLPSRFAIDISGFPDLDRHRISVLAMLVALAALRPVALARIRVSPVLWVCAGLVIGGAFLTAFTNGDIVQQGVLFLSALHPWDGVSLASGSLLDVVAPFLLGCALYRQPRDLERLLRLLVGAGCLFGLLVLFEARMSPQLHKLVYGYHAFGWVGERRWGAYRPIVFMHNGLAVAIFVATTSLAAISLWRARVPVRIVGVVLPTSLCSVYLLGVLMACRSVASLVYGTVGGALLAFARSRVVVRTAVAMAVLTLAYPALRAADAFPTGLLLDAAESFDHERAESLRTRFRNEDRLAERARDRIWFGWGGWNRNRVFDPRTGRDISLTDGYWIILLGIRGVAGFVGVFGLLLVPVFQAGRRFAALPAGRERVLVAGTAWIVAVNCVDLLPNAMFNPVTVFVAGALGGAVSGLRRRRGAQESDGAEEAAQATRRAPAAEAPSDAPGPRPAGGVGTLYRRR